MPTEKSLKNLEKGRFKKNQVSNPKGRPKNSLGIRATIKEVLASDGQITVPAKMVEKLDNETYRIKLPKREALVISLFNRAMSNKAEAMRAIQMIIENTEGAIPQNLIIDDNRTSVEAIENLYK